MAVSDKAHLNTAVNPLLNKLDAVFYLGHEPKDAAEAIGLLLDLVALAKCLQSDKDIPTDVMKGLSNEMRLDILQGFVGIVGEAFHQALKEKFKLKPEELAKHGLN